MVGYAWIRSGPHSKSTGHANPPYKVERPSLRSANDRELFDHFVCKCVDLCRDRHAERLGGLAVDGQLRRSLLDRQLARLRALEDPVHEGSGAAVELGEILTISHQPAGLHEVAFREDRWKTMLEGEPGKLVPLVQKVGIIDHDQGFDTLVVELRERIRKTVRIVRVG